MFRKKALTHFFKVELALPIYQATPYYIREDSNYKM